MLNGATTPTKLVDWPLKSLHQQVCHDINTYSRYSLTLLLHSLSGRDLLGIIRYLQSLPRREFPVHLWQLLCRVAENHRYVNLTWMHPQTRQIHRLPTHTPFEPPTVNGVRSGGPPRSPLAGRHTRPPPPPSKLHRSSIHPARCLLLHHLPPLVPPLGSNSPTSFCFGNDAAI